MPRHPCWHALVDAVAAVRSTDPARVESTVRELGSRRRWLARLAYTAGTVAVVFDGVRLLLRNWRLVLPQVFPAVWIWVMTWNLRNHELSNPGISTTISILLAVGVLIGAQVAYWCNATFAYTMVQGATTDIRAAFREARPHWRLVGGLALLTGCLQAGIWLLVPHLRVGWLWFAMLVKMSVRLRASETETPAVEAHQ